MSILSEAIAAIKSGKKARGQSLLVEFLKNNPQNEIAWMWLATVFEDPQQKKQCLQRVLQINRDNTIARQGLAQLEKAEMLNNLPTLEEITPTSGDKQAQPELTLLSSQKSTPTKIEANSQIGAILMLYLKIVLYMAIPFGLIIGLILGTLPPLILAIGVSSLPQESFLKPDMSGPAVFVALLPGFLSLTLSRSLILGLVLGGFTSLLLGTSHIVSVRRMPAGRGAGALSMHQTRTVELRLPYDQTFNLCTEAILLRGGALHLKNREEGKIAGKTSMNSSWGNTVSFDIDRIGEGRTGVNISSKPSRRILLVDHGSNLENVETIVAFLKLREQQEMVRLHSG